MARTTNTELKSEIEEWKRHIKELEERVWQLQHSVDGCKSAVAKYVEGSRK